MSLHLVNSFDLRFANSDTAVGPENQTVQLLAVKNLTIDRRHGERESEWDSKVKRGKRRIFGKKNRKSIRIP